MGKSREAILNEIRRLQPERRRLLRLLTEDKELAIGTVSTVDRKCGHPSCRCADGPGHAQTLFLFVGENRRRQCKLVRRADEERLLEAGQRYRAFRDGMKRLRAIDRREKELLLAVRDLRALRYE